MLNIPFRRRDPHIGDLLSAWLARKGITEARITGWIRRQRWLRKIGISGCYCGSLRRWLNRLRWLHKFANCLGFRVEYDDGSIH